MSGIAAQFTTRGKAPSPDFRAAVRRANVRSGQIALAEARRRFQPHNRTDRTINETRVIFDGAHGWRLENAEETAGFIEYGTQPHTIEPKNPDGFLAFEVGGETVFAKRVEHPGTTADPWMGPAVVENAPLFDDILAEEIAQEWRRA